MLGTAVCSTYLRHSATDVVELPQPAEQCSATPLSRTLDIACPCAERDSWARVKSGMYKDDLARVIDVDYSTGRATIEVVPRIDYAALASKERALPFGRTPTVRPAPRCVPYLFGIPCVQED